MVNIRIVSGTDRPNSNAIRVSRYLKKQYEAQGAQTQITDLASFPTKAVAGGLYGADIPEVDAFVAPLMEADGLVIVCPEYNGGYPGILKMLIDYLPFPGALRKKPICFVGEANGSFGAVRAVEQLQQVVGYRNAHVFPERVFISKVHENFDESDGIRDDFLQQLLQKQIKNFIQYTRNLSSSAVAAN